MDFCVILLASRRAEELSEDEELGFIQTPILEILIVLHDLSHLNLDLLCNNLRDNPKPKNFACPLGEELDDISQFRFFVIVLADILDILQAHVIEAEEVIFCVGTTSDRDLYQKSKELFKKLPILPLFGLILLIIDPSTDVHPDLNTIHRHYFKITMSQNEATYHFGRCPCCS